MLRGRARRWSTLLILLLAWVLLLGGLSGPGALARGASSPESLPFVAQDDDDDGDEDEGEDDDDDAAPQPAPEQPAEQPGAEPAEQPAPQPAEQPQPQQPVDAPAEPVEVVDAPRDNQAIIRLRPNSDADGFAARYSGAVLRTIPNRDIYLLELDVNRNDDEEVTAISRDEQTVWAERNYTNQAPEGRPRRFFTTGDRSEPMAEDQPAPDLLNLDQAGCATGAGVTVAILDTGIDAAHPALAGRVLPGYNAVADSDQTNDIADGQDDDSDGLVDEMAGHGTHVAGIVAEVAPDADLLPIKVLNSDGIGDAFYVAAGLYAAT